MSRSRQQADEPQSLLGFELCVCKKSTCSEPLKSTEFVLVIKRVLVRFVCVTCALKRVKQRNF